MTDTIQSHPIDSSMMSAIRYDAGRKMLEVTFAPSGSKHHYLDVPPVVVSELLKSDSAGRFFGKHIRGVYTAVKGEMPDA